MVKYEKFFNFIERFFQYNEFQIVAGSIRKAFQEEIFLNANVIHNILKNLKIIWENWKNYSKIDFISGFIGDKSSKILIMWLSEIFNFELNKIEINCPRGPSSIDFLLEISYRYSKNELKIIRDLLIKNYIDNQEDEFTRTLFIESVKSISENFSKIINQPYNIFTSEVNLVKKRGNFKLEYKVADRVIN